MTHQVEVGRRVDVSVPATSANLGPGFDCFGLALDWRERVTLEVIERGFVVDVTGEGADRIPRDESHLIISTVLTGLADLGCRVSGLKITGHNTIPHGRGLGSSSAAIVAGLTGARALAGADADQGWVLGHATAIEGHPDNVAAATYGGFVLAYDSARGTTVSRAVVHPEIGGVVFVPERSVETRTARGLLPRSVSHDDAADNSARAALFVHAMAGDPDLLVEATRDRLHQEYRRSAMPESYDLLTTLRSRGRAAVISGAGPTVLVLGRTADLVGVEDEPGFGRRVVSVGAGASVAPVGLDTERDATLLR